MRVISSIVLIFILIHASSSVHALSICFDNDRALFSDITNGDVAALKKYIDQGGDPNFSCWDYSIGRLGVTRDLVSSVMQSGNEQMIGFLLGIKTLDQTTLDRMLDISLHNLNLSKAKLLVENGAVFNVSRSSHYFSNTYRMDDESFDIFTRYLLSIGADFSLNSSSGSSLFKHVQDDRNGWLNEARYERSMRFLAEYTDINNTSFLLTEICTMESGQLELALEIGATPNVRDEKGNTVIMNLVCCNEHLPEYHTKLKALLDAKADLKTMNHLGQSAETLAKTCSNLKTVSILRDYSL